MNFNQQLEDVRINLRKLRFENELSVLYVQEPKDSVRISQLQTIIDSLKPELKEKKKDTFFREIDKLTFKKTWNRLQVFHRTIKMSEYLEEKYSNKPYYSKLKPELIKMLEEGKLTTKKFVEYDINKEQIISVPCLQIDDASNTYIIKVK